MLQSMRSAAKYIWVFVMIFFVGGFLLLDTAGLTGAASVTPGTTVAEVNGDDISYGAWMNASEGLAQQEEQRLGRPLTLDDRRRVENEAFEQIVTDILLRQEYARRDLTVSDDEIIQAARFSPPPQLMQSPDLQTDGQFDPEKYQRFLSSPAAVQQGLLLSLENYYRAEIPKQKLFEQITTEVYLTDGQLWQLWQDQNDSARVSYVAFRPAAADSGVEVTEAEMRQFYDRNEDNFSRPGRAVVSLVTIPRVIGPADTAATRNRLLVLREEIIGGAAFEDVAERESSDEASAVQGGSLGRMTPDVFVPEFADAARALDVGEVSQPVLSPFGFHLIKLDERQGDTLALRHILIPIAQSDSNAVRTDQRADTLAELGAQAERPAQFDSVARRLQLPVTQVVAFGGEPLTANGRYVPDVSAWAFGGAERGDISELISGDEGYYLARLDSIVAGGDQPFEEVREEIRRRLVQQKAVESLVPAARQLAQEAANTSLEQAAAARSLTVGESGLFTRVGLVPGIGQASKAIGAAFSLPVGAVSAPVVTQDGVFVIRVDSRVEADSATWSSGIEVQREEMTQALRQQRVGQFIESLRRAADIDDRRDRIRATLSGAAV